MLSIAGRNILDEIQSSLEIPPTAEFYEYTTITRVQLLNPTSDENPTAIPKLGPQKCPKCRPSKKAFKDQDALASHLSSGYHERKGDLSKEPEVVPTAKPKPKPSTAIHKCPKCPAEKKAFKNAQALADHLSDCHKPKVDSSKAKATPAVKKPKVKVTSYKCPQCPGKKGFQTQDSLASHLSSGYHARRGQPKQQTAPTAGGPTPKPSKNEAVKCPKCPPTKKAFQGKAALASHLSSGFHGQKVKNKKSTQPTMAQPSQAGNHYQNPKAMPPPSFLKPYSFDMTILTTQLLINHRPSNSGNPSQTTFLPTEI